MQTIEEYKAYARQLEDEVGKWHHAYDALMVERNELVNMLISTEKFLEEERAECDRWRKIVKEQGIELEIARKSNKATQQQLEELIEQINGGDK